MAALRFVSLSRLAGYKLDQYSVTFNITFLLSGLDVNLFSVESATMENIFSNLKQALSTTLIVCPCQNGARRNGACWNGTCRNGACRNGDLFPIQINRS